MKLICSPSWFRCRFILIILTKIIVETVFDYLSRLKFELVRVSVS